MAGELEGRVALITGGGKGLGKAIATELAAAGASLFLVGRNSERLHEAATALEASGAKVKSLSLDLVASDAAQKAVSACTEAFARLDVLINCAGVFVWKKFAELAEADWQKTLDTNLTVPFRMTQAAAKVFAAQGQGGSIVNIGSIHGQLGDGNFVPQVAAKAGLVGLTKATAEALRASGVRVNLVAPGAIEPESGSKRSADLLHKITQGDVADAVRFLASDRARGITGAVLEANGITRPVIASPS